MSDLINDLIKLAKRKPEATSEQTNPNKKKKVKKDHASAAAAAVSETEQYPYPVVPDDHCESPAEAYQDISSFLTVIAKQIGRTPETLKIFDPYFCEGSMKERLASTGFTNVHNEKKDFYELIATETLPEFDVLVTNPPYSGNHMERLLSFCNGELCRKPWFLLMPNYVYTKDYYEPIFKGSAKPFYVTPAHGRRYMYTTPKGRRQEKSAKYTSPFPTFWYCQIYQNRDAMLSNAAAIRVKQQQASKAGSASTISSNSTHEQQPGPSSSDATAVAAAGAGAAGLQKRGAIVVSVSAATIPVEIAPDNDPRKKKLRNNKKRSKNKQRQQMINKDNK